LNVAIDTQSNDHVPADTDEPGRQLSLSCNEQAIEHQSSDIKHQSIHHQQVDMSSIATL